MQSRTAGLGSSGQSQVGLLSEVGVLAHGGGGVCGFRAVRGGCGSVGGGGAPGGVGGGGGGGVVVVLMVVLVGVAMVVLVVFVMVVMFVVVRSPYSCCRNQHAGQTPETLKPF